MAECAIYPGAAFCWGILYSFIVNQSLQGLVSSWSNIVFLPLNTRNGIICFLVNVIYIGAFVLFNYYIYLMIKVCTKCEIEYELEVKNVKFNITIAN